MFEILKNEIDFFIRNNTRFSRKNFRETKTELIERNYKENLYTKDILDKYLSKQPRANARVLDIGCKNWFYAKGEYSFFKDFCEEFVFDGVEIDAFRLYSNFYTRYEVAKYYTKGLSNTNYIPDNLLNVKNQYDYIIWFLPFVIVKPHIYWGLPKRFFYPKRLLKHAFSILKKDGEMLIINQGVEEANAQKKLLDDLNIKYQSLGEIKSDFFQYKNKRFGFLIKK